MWTKTLLLLGLIALQAAQANAQSISLGPQLGFYKARDADNGAFMGGVVCRLKLTPVLGAEASINYRQEKYANDAVTVRSWPVMVTGLIYPLPVVYGAMGMGWYNSTFDYNQSKYPLLMLKDETTQKFGWHFGAGVELPVGSKTKLTGDIRYVFLDYDFKEIPGSSDLKSDFFIITVGLLFKL
ncbi:MAG: porin family protein [Chitinispirillaceae bacterium]|nr:porin family protein [Chitinispirillaceae bacterium]